jgi:benzoyl-CoA reductase/2-hydroxyglutaryl-CoA dehydratase subunit BcrC/BadD/HgdB
MAVKKRGDAGSIDEAPSFQRVMRVMHQLHRTRFEKSGAAWDLLHREITHQALDAFERRAPVVWTSSYAFPMEMIAGLGLIPIDFELCAGLMSSARLAASTLRAADRTGLPQDTCTIHRMAVGAALLDLLPAPDLLVSTSHYCDGKPKTNEFMAHRYGVEYLLLDTPMEDTPWARQYLEFQLRGVFRRLCDLAGREADEALLAEPVRHFNEMTRELQRVQLLRMERPSPPLAENRGFVFGFMTSLLYGTPHATEIYRRIASELQRVEGSPGVRPEALRFLWLMASPTYETPIFSILEERGGRIVAEELSDCHWGELDPANPISSMASRMLSSTFMGPVERRADTVVGLARRYRVDAVLNFGHLSCRQSNGALQVIKGRLDAAGFRLINLEADLSDPANFPMERIRDQLLTHLEVLTADRKRV